MTSLPPRSMILACLFTFVTILTLALAAETTGLKLLIPPFGASAVMIFVFPQSPFCRSKSLIGGHLLTSAIGLGFFSLFPDSTVALAIAVSTGLLGMLLTKTLHPAAGGNPILVYLLKASPGFLLTPIFFGTLFLWLMSRLHSRLQRDFT